MIAWDMMKKPYDSFEEFSLMHIPKCPEGFVRMPPEIQRLASIRISEKLREVVMGTPIMDYGMGKYLGELERHLTTTFWANEYRAILEDFFATENCTWCDAQLKEIKLHINSATYSCECSCSFVYKLHHGDLDNIFYDEEKYKFMAL